MSACRSVVAAVLGSVLALGLVAQPSDEAKWREAARLRGAALAEMEGGNYGRAVEHLRALDTLLPENVLPKINLAICHLKLGRGAEALAAISRARELAPDNPRMLDTLARVLELDTEHAALWREVVRDFAAAHPDDPRPWYHEAQAAERAKRFDEAIPKLRQALERAPENVVVLGDLLVAAGAVGDLTTVGETLDALEDRLDGFEGNLADYARRLRALVASRQREGLAPATVVVRNLLRPLELYQLHLITFQGGRQAGGGALFPQLDFDPPLPASIQGGRDVALAFEDAGRFEDGAGAPGLEPARAGGAEGFSLDVDQDGIADRVSAGPDGVSWFPGRADGGAGAARTILAADGAGGVTGVFPLELDHDGDLDLLIARDGPDLYLQNNGDGTWSERAAELAIAGPDEPTSDVALADFDDDGDLDLLVLHPRSHPRLYLNRRAGALVETGARAGLERYAPGQRAVRVADFDNDGRFDLLLWGETIGPFVLLARGDRFEPRPLPASVGAGWRAAAVSDFDNDGDQDVVAARLAATAPGATKLVLLRNRGDRFDAEELGPAAASWVDLLPGDFDGDGDLDLVGRLEGGERRLLRNQGGHLNQWLRLTLRGKNDNNAKNNVQGLFTRIEVRAGRDFQVVLGNGGVNHLGLGAHRQADVVRVVWTNGLAQTWQVLAAGQTLVEEQVLKGSCPFLYTWNGDEFTFVTDLMWKSPLGMVLADGSPAPHQSAQDFVLVPGEALVPAGGELWLQITEELWEAAYVDRQELIAIDHPERFELVVDEKFTPPPYPETAPIHWLDRRLPPSAATDDRGRDVLPKIAARDAVHVDELPLARYQGTTEPHALELTFSEVPAGERLRLMLWGWIFPTDSSINTALAQDAGRDAVPPRLEVWSQEGWREIVPWLGFPTGKRKAVVAELTGLVPTGEVRLRIPTSMQIYWDAAVLAVGDPNPAAKLTPLAPSRADLHYRGYSKLVRESAASPHLFDYREVSTAPRFRDLEGFYTRYGAVEELLEKADDRYVVMNAGDEMTVVYDARKLPPLPAGWRRDWVLATDGWVKDGDLNTTASQTVEPLPYHGMNAYPDQPEHRYPDDPEHQEYLERYQTRWVEGSDTGSLERETPRF